MGGTKIFLDSFSETHISELHPHLRQHHHHQHEEDAWAVDAHLRRHTTNMKYIILTEAMCKVYIVIERVTKRSELSL